MQKEGGKNDLKQYRTVQILSFLSFFSLPQEKKAYNKKRKDSKSIIHLGIMLHLDATLNSSL